MGVALLGGFGREKLLEMKGIASPRSGEVAFRKFGGFITAVLILSAYLFFIIYCISAIVWYYCSMSF